MKKLRKNERVIFDVNIDEIVSGMMRWNREGMFSKDSEGDENFVEIGGNY